MSTPMTKPDASQITDAATSLERRVAATIADMRGRRGLSQGELAALLGVPATRVGSLESGGAGQAASLAMLAEIAHRLNFHVTLGLHDREAPAVADDLALDRAAAPAATLSTVSLDDGLDLGSAADIFPGDDGAVTIPDEPVHNFLLDDGVAGMTPPKPKDDTFSPAPGDDGFSDGMGN
ncbi:MAG: multiprotein-bridging factor 1 family protein [Sphingomonadales bacterium]